MNGQRHWRLDSACITIHAERVKFAREFNGGEGGNRQCRNRCCMKMTGMGCERGGPEKKRYRRVLR